MSILIKGMEMPKSGCVITIYKIDGNFYASKNGTELCPLVEIPPHGRLIDADEMERTMNDMVQGNIRELPYSDTLWDLAFRWIDKQPTIIEAEDNND